MTIITISRGSYSKGKEIAEKVAERLGYECLGRDLLLEASDRYHIPEIKLVRAIHDAPSILDRFGYRKEKFEAYIQNAFIKHVKDANVVYHGLAGHFLLSGISHVLKVRIIADMEDRIKCEMERENISRGEAEKILKKDDEERRKWTKYLHNVDTWDPSLYDLVIHIRKISVDMAVDLICEVAQKDEFEVTPESTRAMEDLLIASEVKIAVVPHVPYIEVTSDDGHVHIKARGHLSQEQVICKEVCKYAKTVRNVKSCHVEVIPRNMLSE
jgi:cytidylate kinase